VSGKGEQREKETNSVKKPKYSEKQIIIFNKNTNTA